MTMGSFFYSLPSIIHDLTVRTLNLTFLGIISSLETSMITASQNKHESSLTKFIKFQCTKSAKLISFNEFEIVK